MFAFQLMTPSLIVNAAMRWPHLVPAALVAVVTISVNQNTPEVGLALAYQPVPSVHQAATVAKEEVERPLALVQTDVAAAAATMSMGASSRSADAPTSMSLEPEIRPSELGESSSRLQVVRAQVVQAGAPRRPRVRVQVAPMMELDSSIEHALDVDHQAVTPGDGSTLAADWGSVDRQPDERAGPEQASLNP